VSSATSMIVVELKNVETDLQPSAQFADAFVAFALEGSIEKAINQVGCTVKDVDETRDTDEGVNLAAIDAAKHFDLEVAIDFAN